MTAQAESATAPTAPALDIAAELRGVIDRRWSELAAITEQESAVRPAPGKWSARQIIGHLIDSAVNNTPRFVNGQRQEELVFPTYDQDAWVEHQRYQERAWRPLLELWRGVNVHLATSIEGIPATTLTRSRTRHNLDQIAWQTVPAGTPTTLEYLARDYIGHLRHHLAQIDSLITAQRRR